MKVGMENIKPKYNLVSPDASKGRVGEGEPPIAGGGKENFS